MKKIYTNERKKILLIKGYYLQFLFLSNSFNCFNISCSLSILIILDLSFCLKLISVVNASYENSTNSHLPQITSHKKNFGNPQ